MTHNNSQTKPTMKIIHPTYRLFLLCMVLLATAALSGCGVTVYQQHPALQDITENTPVATVYFIRPSLIKPKGFADKPVTVDIDGQHLLEIDQGVYVMLKIRPSKSDVITHSLTKFTNRLEPIKVSRKRSYNFIAGKTYFIYLKQLNEGFRGVFYDPSPATLAQAKKVIVDASPRGDARDARIEDIKEVPDTPPPSELVPAYPEDLYPHYHYLQKKPIVE
jgi:hypothetical protein